MVSDRASDMRDFWDTGLGMVVAFLVLFAGAIGLAVSLSWGFGRAECNNIHTITGRHTEFYLMGGCFVEVDDEMIPLDVWRELE